MKKNIIVFLIIFLFSGCVSRGERFEVSGLGLSLEFLGEAFLPRDLPVAGTTLLGLSGLVRDGRQEGYYAICDDTSATGKARFYRLRIHFGDDGRLDDGDVTVEGVVFLRDSRGEIPPGTFDLEGIALDPDGKTLLFASEGIGDGPENARAPFWKRNTIDGRFVEDLPLPEKLDQTRKSGRGVYNSGGMESLVYSPDHRTLWMAAETALQQDGRISSLTEPALSRLMKFDMTDPARPRAVGEYVYRVEPREGPAKGEDRGGARSLVDLLPFPSDSDSRLLALEREWIQGEPRTNTRPIALYIIDVKGADDVRNVEALTGKEKQVQKTPVLDFEELRRRGLVDRVGSYEAMVYGEDLKDGRHTLIFLEDNDGAVDTSILAFALY